MRNLVSGLVLAVAAGCTSIDELATRQYRPMVHRIPIYQVASDSEVANRVEITEKKIAVAKRVAQINEMIEKGKEDRVDFETRITGLIKELEAENEPEFSFMATRLKNYTYYKLTKKQKGSYVRYPSPVAVCTPLVVGMAPLIYLGCVSDKGFEDGNDAFKKEMGSIFGECYPKGEFNMSYVYDVVAISPYRKTVEVIFEDVEEDKALGFLRANLKREGRAIKLP